MLCVFVVNDLLVHKRTLCSRACQHTLDSARVYFGGSKLKVLQMRMKEDFKHAEDEFSNAGRPNHCKHRSLSLSSSRQLPEFSVCFHCKYPRDILSVLYKTSQFSSGGRLRIYTERRGGLRVSGLIKMKILSSFIYPYVLPNAHDFLSSVEKKEMFLKRYPNTSSHDASFIFNVFRSHMIPLSDKQTESHESCKFVKQFSIQLVFSGLSVVYPDEVNNIGLRASTDSFLSLLISDQILGFIEHYQRKG